MFFVQRSHHRLLAALAFLVLAGAGVVATSHSEPPPKCWGPKSLDAEKPCKNPALRSTVTPDPHVALLEPASDCKPWREKPPEICTFGMTRNPRARVALIGDSHAVHWRAALEVVTRRHRWHGFSIYHSGCAFNLSNVHRLQGQEQRDCEAHNRAIVKWMGEDHGIETVVVSQHDPLHGDETVQRARIQGYIDAWKTFPASVKRIIVIRNPPVISDWSADCVAREVRQGGNPMWDCKEPRSTADRVDTAQVAAEQSGMPHVKVVDLTRFFCRGDWCFPVVGGVLTHKDHGHITRLYSRLLGPYLNRAMFPGSSRR